MTERERDQIRAIVRDVIREELSDQYQWVTRQQLMKMTGKCADTIYRWRKKGQIKSKKIGGVMLYQV